MPSNSPKLATEQSTTSLHTLYAWAKALGTGPEKDKIMAAVFNLADAMQEKLEPGTRSEPLTAYATHSPLYVVDEKLEPGTRSA